MKTGTQIIERALTLIDEQLTEFDVAASTEMSMADIAAEILPEVCQNLVKSLPYEQKRLLAKTATLVAETLSGGEVQTDFIKQKVAYVAPDDFWELVAIRLSVWSNPVTSYILIDGEEYSAQNNPFSRGGKQNPIVAISNHATGSGARIECFSIHKGDTATVSLFQYVAFDNVPDTVNTWPDQLFELTSVALASQLLNIKQRSGQSQQLENEGVKIIEQHI